jgi:hypothetical protein
MSYLSRIAPRLALASLGAVLTIAAACADEQPTSPAAARNTTRTSSPAAAAPSSQIVGAQAKPTDQVGFTKVFTVEGPFVQVDYAAGLLTATATCPAGSTAIGGTYAISNWAQARYFIYIAAKLNGANGWGVTGHVMEPGAFAIVSATVTCAQ